MKTLKILILSLLLILPLAGNAQSSKEDSKVASLIAAIARKYPNPANFYSLITIGSTGYLIKGRSPKILKTRRFSGGGSGMCENYADVRIYASNLKMEDLSEGEDSIWKFDGKTWKQAVSSEEGGWMCRDVRNIPKQVKKCLGITECY